ncbi:hypothetical protein JNUCC0626_20055 [Lentzea sp. JNUCC 0626]|uniref:phage tail tube protein n=1 Tax=Lentzea sp. JNUCC 0626 TaxID=3367513 RepID=UPI003749B167
MATNAELARLGVTGALYVAPLGTVAPVDMSAWPSGWTDLGYISDDGVTESLNEDKQDFVPWQSATPIRTEVTSSVQTFSATLWESKAATISLFYRVPESDMVVTGSAPNQVVSFTQAGKPKRDTRAFGVDVVDGTYHRRIVLPLAEVTERGDVVYKSDSLIGYECTITAYPGSDGFSVKRMFKEGWLPAA